jgi:hypothetical protein
VREVAARQMDWDKSASSFIDINVVTSIMIKLFLLDLGTINTTQTE